MHITHTFIRNRNEPYLPLPSQPQLVLIYRPRRDGMLSRPWCEVAQAEIRIRNLPIANPALYHTATGAHTASTKPSTFKRCNVMDSRRWQPKKRTFKENMAQNIPGRPDESQQHMGRGWTHCDGSSCLASSCCPMCLLARDELSLSI